ncbi:hypothetical protein Tco_1329048 [Tanacetum coccineum]
MSSITKPKHPCGVFTQTQTHPVGVKPEPNAPLGSGRGGGWRGAVMVVWVAVMRWRGWSRGGGGDDDDDKMMMVVATRRGEAAGGGGMARDIVDWVDREMRIIFGFGRKSPPENFSAGATWLWPESGSGGGSSPEYLREKE